MEKNGLRNGMIIPLKSIRMKLMMSNKDIKSFNQKNGKFLYLIIIIFLLPTFFLTENDVQSNEYLNSFSHIFDNVINRIEVIGGIASNSNLYYKAKFIYSYSILIGILIFFITFFTYLKIYLCNIDTSKKCPDFFLIKSIQQSGVNDRLLKLFLSFIFILWIMDFLYIGYFYEYGKLENLTLQTEFGLFFFSFLSSLFISGASAVLVETLAHLYKLINR